MQSNANEVGFTQHLPRAPEGASRWLMMLTRKDHVGMPVEMRLNCGWLRGVLSAFKRILSGSMCSGKLVFKSHTHSNPWEAIGPRWSTWYKANQWWSSSILDFDILWYYFSIFSLYFSCIMKLMKQAQVGTACGCSCTATKHRTEGSGGQGMSIVCASQNITNIIYPRSKGLDLLQHISHVDFIGRRWATDGWHNLDVSRGLRYMSGHREAINWNLVILVLFLPCAVL